MKEFRKTQEGFFICEECGKLCKSIISLAKHIVSHSMNSKEYYNKWLLENDENLCKICGKETKFITLKSGYRKTCGKNCANILFKNTCLKKYGVISPLGNKILRNKGKKTNLIKYGVENPMQSEIIKNKVKETNLKKYGVKNTYQRTDIKEKIKQIKKERYGDEKYQNWKKQRQTCLQRYGTEYVLSKKEIREKAKETMKLKYGG